MQEISLKILKNYPFSLFIALTIWIVCMIPIPETPLGHISFIDKWTHFVMYATLTLSILVESKRTHKPHKPYKLIIIPVIMGGLVELAQAYLTTCRSGNWFDFLCNALGCLLGLGIFSITMRLKS